MRSYIPDKSIKTANMIDRKVLDQIKGPVVYTAGSYAQSTTSHIPKLHAMQYMTNNPKKRIARIQIKENNRT